MLLPNTLLPEANSVELVMFVTTRFVTNMFDAVMFVNEALIPGTIEPAVVANDDVPANVLVLVIPVILPHETAVAFDAQDALTANEDVMEYDAVPNNELVIPVGAICWLAM